MRWIALHDGEVVEKERTKRRLIFILQSGHLDTRKNVVHRVGGSNAYIYVAPRGQTYIIKHVK